LNRLTAEDLVSDIFRQDHDAMQAAAMRPVTGPASTDTLAAGGGLDVPGRESHPELLHAEPGTRRELIPGERDATTLTHRESGAVSGQFAGADIPPAPPEGWMDDTTANEHAREGGATKKVRSGK
jgi:hypothetical protein